MALLEIENLDVCYGDLKVIGDLSLPLKKEELPPLSEQMAQGRVH